MSYEGYTQNICKNGHLFDRDAFSRTICDCGAEAAWPNQVDETNCYGVGFIPFEEFKKLMLTPTRVKTCNLGHQHVLEEATYRLPEPNELQRTKRTPKGEIVPIDAPEPKVRKQRPSRTDRQRGPKRRR